MLPTHSSSTRSRSLDETMIEDKDRAESIAESTTDTIVQPQSRSRNNSMAKSYAESTVSGYTQFTKGESELEDIQSLKPLRAEVNKVLGEDMTPHVMEISTFPCAGLRISHGRLSGLYMWRFVVQLDEPSVQFRKIPRQAVMTNFILDTGSATSPIPPQTLVALGYKGDLTPGSEVVLAVQGVRTKCVVAQPNEAGRLCGRFMTAGDLTFYFDSQLDAPVLYVAKDGVDKPRSTDVPRTVTRRFSQKILSILNFSKQDRFEP